MSRKKGDREREGRRTWQGKRQGRHGLGVTILAPKHLQMALLTVTSHLHLLYILLLSRPSLPPPRICQHPATACPLNSASIVTGTLIVTEAKSNTATRHSTRLGSLFPLQQSSPLRSPPPSPPQALHHNSHRHLHLPVSLSLCRCKQD